MADSFASNTAVSLEMMATPPTLPPRRPPGCVGVTLRPPKALVDNVAADRKSRMWCGLDELSADNNAALRQENVRNNKIQRTPLRPVPEVPLSVDCVDCGEPSDSRYTIPCGKNMSVLREELGRSIRRYAIMQRVCSTFVLDVKSKDNMCVCGRNHEWHSNVDILGKPKKTLDFGDVKQDVKKEIAFPTGEVEYRRQHIWDINNHTSVSPCTTYGAVYFPKSSNIDYVVPYMRFDSKTTMEDLCSVVTKDDNTQLVLHVIMGSETANNTDMSALKHGLIKTAINLKGLIMTQGNNEKASLFVREALDDYNSKYDTAGDKWSNVANISSWGCVANRDILEGRDRKGQWPVEYAVEQSKDFTNGQHVLDDSAVYFLFVDDGTVGKSGAEEQFCSGKNGHRLYDSEYSFNYVRRIMVVIGGEVSMSKRVCMYLNNGHSVLAIGGSPDFINDISSRQSSASLVNAVDVKSPIDVQHAVFSTVAKSEFNYRFVAYLASETYTRERQNGWEHEDVCHVLFLASQSGYADKEARHLMNNGASFRSFLTKEWLTIRSHDVSALNRALLMSLRLSELEDVSHLLGMGVEMPNDLSVGTLWSFYCKFANKSDDAAHLVRHLVDVQWKAHVSRLDAIAKLILELVKDCCLDFMQAYDEADITAKLDMPGLHLFVLAVLFNNADLAFNCLNSCPNQTSVVIFGAALLKGMTTKAKQHERFSTKYSFLNSLKTLSHELENCAIYILTNVTSVMEKDIRESIDDDGEYVNYSQIALMRENMTGDDVILKESVDYLGGTTALTMIETNRLMDVASCTSVQTSLTRTWKGKKLCYSPNKHSFGSVPPKITFVTNVITNVFVLVIFGMFLLTDLKLSSYSWNEIVVWIWFTSLIFEELKEICHGNTQKSWRSKLNLWWSSRWNKFDLCLYVSMIISVTLRLSLHAGYFKLVRYSYCSTFILASLRCLQYFYVFEHMGPKIVMLLDMAAGLIRFIIILMVPVVSFGVAYQSISAPNSPLEWNILPHVLTFTFFQMFGELSLDGLVEDNVCEQNDSFTETKTIIDGCMEKQDDLMIKILVSVYILMTNVLFINLLTASIFSKTLEAEKEKTNVWRFHRIALVREFSLRSIIPLFAIVDILLRLCCSSNCNTWRQANASADYIGHLRKHENKCTMQYVEEMKSQKSEDRLSHKDLSRIVTETQREMQELKKCMQCFVQKQQTPIYPE